MTQCNKLSPAKYELRQENGKRNKISNRATELGIVYSEKITTHGAAPYFNLNNKSIPSKITRSGAKLHA